MLNSYYTDLGAIELPVWQGRQEYMQIFNADNIQLKEGFEDYTDVVSTLLSRANISGNVYMTVDEKIVEPGFSQRRPGPHVDGRFMPNFGWTHGGGSGWAHYCNNLPLDRMNIIVASSVAGCKIYEGVFDGEPKNDGDLSHIANQLGDGVLFPANRGALLSPDCVHESMIFNEPTQRLFLRLAFN